jgi:DNA-binding transcriptional LysR family regulator
VTRSETGERVLALLRAQEVDLGVFLALGPAKGLASEIIGTEELCLVAAPGHTLAGRRSVSPVLLSEFGFVGGIAESHFAHIVGIVMRRLGVRRHRVVAEAQDAETVKELARHGAGLAWCLASTVAEDIRIGTLTPIALTRTIPALEVRWAAAPGRPLSPHALALVRHLKSKPAAKSR